MGSLGKPSQPDRVGIIGAGVIGAAWSARWLLRGSDVSIFDPAAATERLVNEVLNNARHSWERMGVAPLQEGSLTFANSVEEASEGAVLIQESIPEDVGAKKNALNQIEKSAPASALIASSTSGLLPSRLQEDMNNPERFLVGHPFNPVYLLPMVEVVGGDRTSDEAISSAIQFYEIAGMKPVHVRVEIDAFVADRLLEAV